MSTPLATVAVITGELRNEAVRNAALAPYRDELAIIEEQIEACKLALDRMGMDMQAPHAASSEAVSVSEWLRHFVDLWRLRHPAVVLRLSLPASSGPVLDQQLLGQIVLTLLDNAGKAVAEHGKIELELTVDSHEAVLRVADDGPGIPADMLKRLGYEPVRSTTGGQGIGLMLAFATARQLGGRLILASPSRQGVNAILHLPLQGPARTLPQATFTTPPVSLRGRKTDRKTDS